MRTPYAVARLGPMTRSRTAIVLTALLLGLAAAASWWGWLGWDTNYQTDPRTGVMSGPYEAWQVLGCVLTLLSAGLLGATFVHPRALALMPWGFTIAWSITSSRDDETGLWLVGAFMVLIGMSLGCLVVGLAGRGLGRLLSRGRTRLRVP